MTLFIQSSVFVAGKEGGGRGVGDPTPDEEFPSNTIIASDRSVLPCVSYLSPPMQVSAPRHSPSERWTRKLSHGAEWRTQGQLGRPAASCQPLRLLSCMPGLKLIGNTGTAPSFLYQSASAETICSGLFVLYVQRRSIHRDRSAACDIQGTFTAFTFM